MFEKLNIQRMEIVANLIQAEPLSFNMSRWHTKTGCNTTHCIAGWAQHTFLKDGERAIAEDFDFRFDTSRHAAKGANLLGLEIEFDRYGAPIPTCEAASVFFTLYWPEPYKQRYEDAEDTDLYEEIKDLGQCILVARAQIAYEYLMDIIQQAKEHQGVSTAA